MKKANEPKPFRLLKEMPARTWELCDKCMELKPEMQWSDRCILPIAAGMAVAGEIGMNPAADGYKVSALYAWRKYKEIYSFDDDLAEILIDQADSGMDIPMPILYQLPYPCIFIQYKSAGFFVHFEHDVNNQQFELRMWYINDAENVSIPLILHIEDDCTIDQAMQKTVEEAKRHTKHPDDDFFIEQGGEIMAQKAAELLQFVLYICADNSEKEENPEQKKVTRRTDESEKKPKDVFREIRKWDVGFRIGSQIRRMKADRHDQSGDQSEAPARTYQKGSKKAPHARRGHWHHYWIGKHETDERKLILKWVAPIFINGDEGDNIATIHPVK